MWEVTLNPTTAHTSFDLKSFSQIFCTKMDANAEQLADIDCQMVSTDMQLDTISHWKDGLAHYIDDLAHILVVTHVALMETSLERWHQGTLRHIETQVLDSPKDKTRNLLDSCKCVYLQEMEHALYNLISACSHRSCLIYLSSLPVYMILLSPQNLPSTLKSL